MCSRWFTLTGRLALKGCLGSHRLSQLMRGDGGDRSTSHRETDAVKTVRVPWKNTASTSWAQQIRADHNKVDQRSQSSAARKSLSSGSTSCTLGSNLFIRYRSLSLTVLKWATVCFIAYKWIICKKCFFFFQSCTVSLWTCDNWRVKRKWTCQCCHISLNCINF